MTLRTPLVAANWKMNGTLASIRSLMTGLQQGLQGSRRAEIAVCVPFPYLGEVAGLIGEAAIGLGAQNLSEHEAGAFTGEVSATMLCDYNCRFVIVGHSERRALYGESDLLAAAKFHRAAAAGLVPILCVGESLEQREEGATEAVVARQLDAVLGSTGAAGFAGAVIAYEPVWAIGTGRTATAEQAQAVHAFIRGRLAAVDGDLAARTRVLYGGSVKGDNAVSLFSQPDVDGGLVGGASLKLDEFLQICRAAD